MRAAMRSTARTAGFLLSGLLVCGACGGAYTIVGADRYGCATRRCKGTCTNTLVIGRKEVEERVLSGLKKRMMAPELVATFVEEFNAELRRIAEVAETEQGAARRRLADIDRKIAGIIKAIEDGAYNATLKARLSALEQEKAQAVARLASSKPTPIVRLHPNLPALYRSKVEKLAEALNEPATAVEAGEILRGLIERVVLTPIGNALHAELYGDFATIAALTDGRSLGYKNPGSVVSRDYCRWLRGEDLNL